jgi:hypothetical protein
VAEREARGNAPVPYDASRMAPAARDASRTGGADVAAAAHGADGAGRAPRTGA